MCRAQQDHSHTTANCYQAATCPIGPVLVWKKTRLSGELGIMQRARPKATPNIFKEKEEREKDKCTPYPFTLPEDWALIL